MENEKYKAQTKYKKKNPSKTLNCPILYRQYKKSLLDVEN